MKSGSRRKFLLLPENNSETNTSQPEQTGVVPPEPSPAQKHFESLRKGMFAHFGINTFNNKEWSYGELPVSSYKPTGFDPESWCRAAKKAGMNYIIFTAKHVDGFCNWPTKFTDYSVAKTDWYQDALALVAKAARKQGLELGIYYCLWDGHHPDFKDNEPAYNQYVINQVTELLTNYGPVLCLWFDGFWKKQKSGWDKNESPGRADRFMNSWRNEGAFRLGWDKLYATVKSLQPNCIVFNNSTTDYPGVPLMPVDARCAERGTSMTKDQKIWYWKGEPIYLPLQIETTASTKGDPLFPSGNWFWHETDHSVASADEVKAWINHANELAANFVLNFGPGPDGKLRPEDLALLAKLAG